MWLIAVMVALAPSMSPAGKGDPIDKTNYKMASAHLVEAFQHIACIRNCPKPELGHPGPETGTERVVASGAARAATAVYMLFVESFSAELVRRTVDYASNWFETAFAGRLDEKPVIRTRGYLERCRIDEIIDRLEGAYVMFACRDLLADKPIK